MWGNAPIALPQGKGGDRRILGSSIKDPVSRNEVEGAREMSQWLGTLAVPEVVLGLVLKHPHGGLQSLVTSVSGDTAPSFGLHGHKA